MQDTGTQSPSKPNCVGRTSIHILEANCIRLNCKEDLIPIILFPVSGRISPQKASEVGRGRRNGGPRLACPDPRCSLSMLLPVSACLPLGGVYLISTFPFSPTEMSSDSWLTLPVPQCDSFPSSAKSQDCYSWIRREYERRHRSLSITSKKQGSLFISFPRWRLSKYTTLHPPALGDNSHHLAILKFAFF